jgi:dihydrolipoamide dehydrogenase
MSDTTFDLVVIGSGPGGYVAAIRAAQLGLKTAIVEKEPTLGGTCLNVGCIPSKALLESSAQFDATKKDLGRHGILFDNVRLDLTAMLKRKDDIVRQGTNGVVFLMKKNGIEVAKGFGRVVKAGQVAVRADDGTERLLDTKRILVASGSVPVTIPGVELDGVRVGTSTEALTFAEVPKHFVVIGAGVIGLELGSVWRRLGAQVTVLEYMDRILPGMDLELANAAQRLFERQGFKFVLGAKVTGAKAAGDHAVVTYVDKAGATQVLEADRCLVAVGRRAFTDALGLKDAGVELDSRGRVVIDQHFATNVPGIWAIGDVVAGAMLAHKASEEGVAAVETMVSGHGHVNYDAIPGIVYTAPEIASVGAAEEDLQKKGIAYKKGSFPFAPLGRAKAIGHTEGFVKILSDAKTDRILGAHIIGHHAGDLIAELAVAMEFGSSAEDIARSSHAHPTMAEAIKEAALAVDGRAIHGA